MPIRKLPHIKQERTNTTIHPVIKSRGLKIVQRLGYDLSSAIEVFLEKLHEAHVAKGRKLKPGDFLEVKIFDRSPDPVDKNERKKKAP